MRPGGAEHQWRKIPPDPVAMQFDFAAERFGEPFKRLLWTLRDLLLMWFGRRHCHDIRPSYAYGFEAVPGAPLQARARHRGYQLATICRPTPRLPPITTMVLPANGSILFSWNRCLHIRFMGGTAMCRTGAAAETHRSLTIFFRSGRTKKMEPDHRAMIGVSVQLSVGLGSPLPVVIRLRKLSLM